MASKYWIAVACASHVERGVENGFMQVCHGKSGPLQRMKPGDGVVYYSPTKEMGDREKLQYFTALGFLQESAVYQVEQGDGFYPFRRDVIWQATNPTPIRPLLDELNFSAGKRNWAYPMRFGLFEITKEDFARIQEVMVG